MAELHLPPAGRAAGARPQDHPLRHAPGGAGEPQREEWGESVRETDAGNRIWLELGCTNSWRKTQAAERVLTVARPLVGGSINN